MFLFVFTFIALSCDASHPSRNEAAFDTDEDEDDDVSDQLEKARQQKLERDLQELQKNLLVYYINTDTEPERREHMETQAKTAKMSLQRFKAIDRNRISMGEFDDRFVRRQGLAKELLLPEREKDHVRNATVACYVSHAQLLEELQKKMGPSQVAIVLEDDVQIPHNWLELVKKTLDCAPEDWSLLKVSGWGYSRDADHWKPKDAGAPRSLEKAARSVLAQQSNTLSSIGSSPVDADDVPLSRGESMNSAQNFMGFLQSHGGWMSKILYGDAEPKKREKLIRGQDASVIEQRSRAQDATVIEQSSRVQDEQLSCPDAYLMRQPFKEQFWWHFWGPAFHYAGTGAYIVKATSISSILQHLQSQPIDDVDGMLLSKGELRAYELWPHIFPLTTDHMRSTLLSTGEENEQEEDISKGPAEKRGKDTIISGLSSWLPSWDSPDGDDDLDDYGGDSSEGGKAGPAALLSGKATGFPCKRGVLCNRHAQRPQKQLSP